jgi:hypothetical protein
MAASKLGLGLIAGRMPRVTLISAPAGFGKSTLVFAPSCMDIIGGIIQSAAQAQQSCG